MIKEGEGESCDSVPYVKVAESNHTTVVGECDILVAVGFVKSRPCTFSLPLVVEPFSFKYFTFVAITGEKRMLFYVKIIDINIPAMLTGSVVKQSIAVTAEVGIDELHFETFADRLECLTVSAISKRYIVGNTVNACAEPDILPL